jgi:hypothetical protein
MKQLLLSLGIQLGSLLWFGSVAFATLTAAGPHYRANSVHRLLLGGDYRDLWTTPIEAPLLDLNTYAGGLKPAFRVGGQETLGLAMKGADGHDYTFRGIDKDPSDLLPSEYKGTFVDKLIQDQIASSMPGGSSIVPPLLAAVGVLHVEPKIVVMPDDSSLGEFRKAFGNQLGTIEEYPRAPINDAPGTFGATEIIKSDELWKRMATSPSERVDARAFLTARLVDLLIGDWDRHRNQWHWARIPGKPDWQPIPEDRDQAFVRFEGLLPAAGREHLPQFVNFSKEYPDLAGLTWNARDVDRRFLVELDKPEWDEIVAMVHARITDDVIAASIQLLPAEYRKVEGARLETALRQRRDALPAYADRFYHFLAKDVDVHTSDQPEVARVTHLAGGDVDVKIETAGQSSPVFERTFHPKETDEVRLYLEGGNDSLVTSGPRGGVTVRVVGGEGNDVIDDRAGTRLHVSDASGENSVLRGNGTSLDTRPYTAPVRKTAPWIPPRDWGRRTVFLPAIGGNSDLGVLFVASIKTTGYGFRKDPYADTQTLRLAYATKAGSFGADYTGEFRRENSPLILGLYSRLSGLDFLHFYGFGNDTRNNQTEDFYKLKHNEYVLRPSVSRYVGKHSKIMAEVPLKYSQTDLQPDRLITEVKPYGTEDFFQAGLGAGVEMDTRQSPAATSGGVRTEIHGNVYPELGAVKSTFGEVHGEVSLYQPMHFLSTPTIALRAGGRQVWGTYPYHEAAYIGGARTVRGFAQQRFAGDAALFGNAELRIPIVHTYILVPGNLGVFGLFDTGRVYLDGESSTTWHNGVGGGLWMSFVDPANAVSLSIANSEEGTRVYVHLSMSF